MQYDLSCKTIQLKSKNRQTTGWKTSRPIPRHAIFSSSGVSEAAGLRIRTSIAFFLFGPFPCLNSGCNPRLHFFMADKGETTLLKAIIAF